MSTELPPSSFVDPTHRKPLGLPPLPPPPPQSQSSRRTDEESEEEDDDDDDQDDSEEDDEDDDDQGEGGGKGAGGGGGATSGSVRTGTVGNASGQPSTAAAAPHKKSGSGKPKDPAAGARKQNVACDNCRSRKVKCTRTNGSPKCDSCVQKQLLCTAHYVNSLSHKEKRKLEPRGGRSYSPINGGNGTPNGLGGSPAPRGSAEKSRNKRVKTHQNGSSNNGSHSVNPPLFTHQPHSTTQQLPPLTTSHPHSSHHTNHSSSSSQQPYQHQPPPRSSHSSHSQQPPALSASSSQQQHQPYSIPSLPAPYLNGGPNYSSHTVHAPPMPAYAPPSFPPSMTNLLLYLFSPMEVTGMELGYSDREAVDREGKKNSAFSGIPTRAHRSLSDESLRLELANDLIETYFQIVHIRMPLLSPTLFRAQFRSPSSLSQPPHVTVAVVLAWGAKFSEHPVIVMDREETSASMERRDGGRSRSRLVRLLVVRAQEVLEANRAFRVAKVENLQAALLMEPLLGHPFSLPNTTPGSDFPWSKSFWTTTAIRHLLELQANKSKTIVAIADEQERGSLVFAWWLATLADAHGAAYFRRMPVLSHDDYNIEPPQIWDGDNTVPQTPHPLGTLSEYMIWYIAAHSLACTSRRVCRELWTPEKEENGIPIASLRPLIDALAIWRDEHLSKVGVPSVWPATWDFVAAVTACSSDSNYHVMWLIINRAVDDFGIRETILFQQGQAPHVPEADLVRERISQEALHGALRISALASVLTTNGYLRLDPNFLQFSLLEAGFLLAKLGRPEVEPCVAGLRQYGMSFEECYDQADLIIRIYDEARKRSAALASGFDTRGAVMMGRGEGSASSSVMSMGRYENGVGGGGDVNMERRGSFSNGNGHLSQQPQLSSYGQSQPSPQHHHLPPSSSSAAPSPSSSSLAGAFTGLPRLTASSTTSNGSFSGALSSSHQPQPQPPSDQPRAPFPTSSFSQQPASYTIPSNESSAPTASIYRHQPLQPVPAQMIRDSPVGTPTPAEGETSLGVGEKVREKTTEEVESETSSSASALLALAKVVGEEVDELDEE